MAEAVLARHLPLCRGQLAQAQPAAALASAGVRVGLSACSSGVQQAVVPQQASGALSALVPRVSASALTT